MAEMITAAGTGSINQSRRVKSISRKAKPRSQKKRKSNNNRKRS